MALKHDRYIPRLCDAELMKNLEAFGAVLINGPKWCGKTTTAEQAANSALYLQDEDRRAEYEAALEVRPSSLLEGRKPRLIDEWQMAPVLWNTVRKSVDDANAEGLYILTGSTSAERRDSDHSGCGRIVEMRMHTMSLFESGDSTGEVSLRSLFGDTKITGRSGLSVDDIAERIIRGGWPRSVGKSTDIACRQIAGYCENILSTPVQSEDDPDRTVARDTERMREVLRSLARNTATQTPDTTILRDIESKDNVSISINTLRDYIRALRRIYVVDDLPAWNPRLRSKATVRTSDTRHLCDPAVAAYFLGASVRNLTSDFRTFGLLFESMAVRDLRVYAAANGGDVMHYRDSDGLEADAIIRIRHTGEWGAVEVKLGQGKVDEASSNLLKLSGKTQDPPSFLAVVTGTEYAYTREDGVHVVPLGCLRD